MKGILHLFLIITLLLSTSVLAQTIPLSSNVDRACSGEICQTTIYSYEKYWFEDKWEEIDESWKDCSIENKKRYCTNEYYFKVVADDTGLISSNIKSRSFDMRISKFRNSILTNNFSIEVDGSILTYKNILPHIDLRYQYSPKQLKEDLVINRPLESLSEDFEIEFDTTGDLKVGFLDSIICDSNYTCEKLESHIRDNKISVTIPRSFLNHPDRVYPLIVDPTIVLNESYINWNGYVSSAATDPPIYSRTNNPSHFPLYVERRGSIQWDLSSIPNSASILNASIFLVLNSTSTPYNVSLWHMEGNNNTYPLTSGDCEGNCHFFNDIGNGTEYNKTAINSLATFVNLILSSEALTNIEDHLGDNWFSTGITVQSSSIVNIYAKDHPESLLRPKLVIVHSYRNYTLAYDSNGNLISGFGKIMTYDDFNRLKQVNDSSTGKVITEYVYDYEGTRIKKVEYNIDLQANNRTTYYPFKEFIQERITNGTILNYTYYYLNDKLIASKQPDGSKLYYHPDHLGSTTLITNQSGDVVEEVFYLPFGQTLIGSDEASRFLFNGKEKDDLTGFYDYGARQYDPEFSRFVQPDPIIADVYDPQNLNRYSYVLNNPYKYTDPDGRTAVEIGPSLSLTITIPGTPIGISGQLGAGRAIAYNPSTGKWQTGQYATFGGGAGGDALGAKAGLNLISIYPEANSLQDLEGSSLSAGFSGGDGVTVGFDADISGLNLKDFNPTASNPSISIGIGGGLEGHLYRTTTITSGPQSISDIISGEISGTRVLSNFINNKLANTIKNKDNVGKNDRSKFTRNDNQNEKSFKGFFNKFWNKKKT